MRIDQQDIAGMSDRDVLNLVERRRIFEATTVDVQGDEHGAGDP